MPSPSAQNGLTSYAFHFQRRKYVRTAYVHFLPGHAMDLWYGDKALYGRINPQGETVVVKEENLTNFVSSPELVALNFVVDAFEKFREFVIEGLQGGIFGGPRTFLFNLAPKQAYENPLKEQGRLLSLFGEKFYKGYIPENNRDREIATVEDYASVFFEYFSRVATSIPLTSTSLARSSYVSPLASGLVVELSIVDHSDDQVKFDKFVSDPNFYLYQQAARKFGFKIDYNAPWRMIADVSTAEMKEYMAVYGILSYRQLFREYYETPVVSDLVALKDFIFNSYNDFVEFNPYTKIPRLSKDKLFKWHQDRRTKFCIIDRFEVTPEEFNGMFDEFYWLKFYFKMRSMELGIKWGKVELSKEHQRIERLLKGVDIDRAIEYAENQLKKRFRG